MKLKKIAAAAIACACLWTSFMTASAAFCADDGFENSGYSYIEEMQGDLTFAVYSDHAELTACAASAAGEVTIPAEIMDLPVTVIGEKAFYSCSGISSVIIPDNVAVIGDEAFSKCSAIENFSIPDSVQIIGSNSFSGTAWLNECIKNDPLVIINGNLINGTKCEGDVIIPHEVKRICGSAFVSALNMTSVTLPDTVEFIGSYAFAYCNIKEIVIPDSVSQIDPIAFYNCPYLSSVRLSENLTTIEESTFRRCSKLTSIELPKGLKSIDPFAFANTGLTSVELPENLIFIGERAFAECRHLTDVIFPKKLQDIESFAFKDTPWLASEQKKSPFVVVNGVLIDASLATGDVTVPDNVIVIGDDAFSRCKELTAITIPEGVRKIGTYAFLDCDSLQEILVPSSVEEIGSSAFAHCDNLRQLTVLNPNCQIFDDKYFVYNEFVNVSDTLYKGCIVCYNGSTAQAYAEKYCINCVLWDMEKNMPGDVNGDGNVGAADLVTLRNWLLGKSDTLEKWENADLCEDGVINVYDMVMLRRLLIEKNSVK